VKSHLFHGFIVENTGKIIAGHCNCIGGMGESCSYVASLLWEIESGVRIRDSLTPTDKKAYWVIPQAVKQVPFSPVKNINFKGKKRSLQQLNMPSIIKIHLQWLVFFCRSRNRTFN